MVGRFVEQQHVGLLRQRANNRRAAALSATRGLRRPRQVDTELVGDRRGLVGLWRVTPAQHPLLERLETLHLGILLEQHDIGAGHDGALAFIGVDQVGEALEQGRLAGTVTADQRQPVAFADVKVEVAEQPAFALNKAEVFVGKDRGGHARPLTNPARGGLVAFMQRSCDLNGCGQPYS